MYSRERVPVSRPPERTVEETARGPVDQEQPQDYVLGLQQKSGNAAVARLVQRAPADRPASTDAPGHHHDKGKKDEPQKPAPDVHARIIKYDIDGDMTRITIASGPDQGIKVGMSGSLLTPHGKEYADFVIETAEGRVSTAHVKATPDEVRANSDCVVKPSTLESQAGKEF
jgi:hypothetical protein